jgi:DNA polymerase III alpha subunit (gram-positive type)
MRANFSCVWYNSTIRWLETIINHLPLGEFMRLAFLDTETTGLKAWKHGETHHEITELALIVHEDGKEVYRGCWKFFPRRIETANPIALEIGGYDQATWDKEAIEWNPTFIKSLCSILDGSAVVGHNVRFDVGFLRALFSDFDIKFKFPPELDTKTLAKMVWGFDSLKMDNIRKNVEGMTCEGAHRALKDTEDCVFIYQQFQQMMKATA